MAIAGKVAITPKGNWSASTAYQKLDLVYYNNASYVAIQPSTGVTPTNTAYWMLALQSADGADFDGIINGDIQVGNAKTLDGNGVSYFAKDSDLIVERERISNLAKLNEGSTTGDAELIDARVGADGKTYDNVGDAVRGQVSDLKSDLSNLENDLMKHPTNKDLKINIATYLNPESGTGAGSGIDVTKYATTSYTQIGDAFSVELNSNVYEMCVWCYESTSVTAKTYTPTNGGYTSGKAFVYSGLNSTVFRIGLHRIDDAVLTEQDITAFRESLKFYSFIDTSMVDPDRFTGTDSEKIQKAMQEVGDTNNGVILIKRMYTLDNVIKISHDCSVNAKLMFVGIGKNCGFVLGNNYFMAYDNTKSYGSCSFSNLQFISNSRHFYANQLIRMYFDNCSFSGGSSIVRNQHYMQTWLFDRCIMRDTTSYCILSDNTQDVVLLDVQFNECTIERCNGFLYAYAVHGVTINQCCIEGLSERVCFVGGDSRSFNITNNYFESNNNGYLLQNPDDTPNNGESFDFSTSAGNVDMVVIANNRFVQQSGNEIILLPPKNPSSGYYVIENNHTSPGVVLVKTYPNFNGLYTNVILRANGIASYSDSHLLNDSTKSNMGYVNNITEGLNDLSNSGFYYSQDASAIENSPTTGELYLLHLKTLDGFAQLAITNEGLKSRIGVSDWK